MRSARDRRRSLHGPDEIEQPPSRAPDAVRIRPDPAAGAAGRRLLRKGRLLTRKRVALLAIVLVGISYATMIQSFSWNQASHYDLIRSLNNDGTTIDAYQSKTRATRSSTRATTTRRGRRVWRCSHSRSTTR